MSDSGIRAAGSAAALRDAFDRSFAQTPTTREVPVESLLAIGVGGHRYALRMSEVSGLFASKRVTWLPGRMPELLGIAGFRGTVLPVWDLAMLLGYPRGGPPRWLVLSANTPVALGFEGFDGYLAARRDAILPDARASASGRHAREVVETGDLARPLVSLASIGDWIRRRASGEGL